MNRIVDLRYWHKADIAVPSINVRFWGNSGHRSRIAKCLLLNQADIPLAQRRQPQATFKIISACTHKW